MFQPDAVTPVIIRDVPPRTPEVSVVDVLTGSIGLVGVILVSALVAGLFAGGLFIAYRRWLDRRLDRPDDGPTTLDLSSPPR